MRGRLFVCGIVVVLSLFACGSEDSPATSRPLPPQENGSDEGPAPQSNAKTLDATYSGLCNKVKLTVHENGAYVSDDNVAAYEVLSDTQLNVTSPEEALVVEYELIGDDLVLTFPGGSCALERR